MLSRLSMGSIIGREDAIDQIDRLLWDDEASLVTLTGPGGVGKTRLAIDVANRAINRNTGAVYWVELGAVRAVDQVLPTIARTIRLSLTSEVGVLEQIALFLGDSECLLILDNIEQVVDSALPLVGLLHRCPGVRLLVTSRVSLRVTPEREVAVAPLTHSQAMRVFVERARERQPGFGLTHEVMPLVQTICDRLDGLPLAIELAVARLPVLSLQDLAERIDLALAVLGESPRDKPERQHTMRSTIAWSYDLLTDDEQDLFRLASSFPDGFRLVMLEAVMKDARVQPGRKDEPTGTLLTRLASLVEQNLLRVVPGEGNRPTRYRMFETIREYGLEQLAAHDDMDGIMRARADAALEALQSTRERLFGDQAPELLQELDAELRNLRDLFQWSLDAGEAELGLDLANAVGSFWIVRGHYHEGSGWLEQLLEATPNARPEVRALGFSRLGWLQMLQGNFTPAEAALENAILLGTASNAQLTIAVARLAESFVQFHRGRVPQALDLSNQAVTVLRSLRETTPVAMHFESIAYAHRGEIYLAEGDDDLAREATEQALQMQHLAGFGWAAGDSHRVLGHLDRQAGDLDAAMYHYTTSLNLGLEHGDPRMLAETVASIGYVFSLRGDPVTGATLLGISAELRRRGGEREITWDPETYDRAVTRTTELLGERDFQQNWTAGKQREVDQALELVTGVLPAPAKNAESRDMVELTPREREVLTLLLEGLSDREIADRLSLSARTVGGHVSNLLVKFGAQSRTAAAVQAVRLGFDR